MHEVQRAAIQASDTHTHTGSSVCLPDHWIEFELLSLLLVRSWREVASGAARMASAEATMRCMSRISRREGAISMRL